MNLNSFKCLKISNVNSNDLVIPNNRNSDFIFEIGNLQRISKDDFFINDDCTNSGKIDEVLPVPMCFILTKIQIYHLNTI